MSKIAHYLQEHLLGEVTTSPEARKHFARDASILQLTPAVIVYPRNEDDVRKTVRFAWQLAERGKVLPITARGSGSDTSGGAIGSGIIMVFPAHMNKILSLEASKALVTVEPGLNYDALQQALHTNGLFFPPYPASSAYATIGGGLANNATGEKSLKYGDTLQSVQRLQVVLSNGELIETGPLNKKELSRKMGLSSMEGEIYRSLDGLIEENHELINKHGNREAAFNSAGYNLWDIKKNGVFDLTPLLIGSEGTLGIITEATLKLAPYNASRALAWVSFPKLADMTEVLPRILGLKPSICDMINKAALESVAAINPRQLSSTADISDSEIHLLVEFDQTKDAQQKKCLKSLKSLIEKVGGSFHQATNEEEKLKLWKMRQSIATTMLGGRGASRAVPIAEDVCVPVSSLENFLQRAIDIYQAAGLAPAAWGQAGSGVVRMQPMLDLAELGDRQKLFKVSGDIYSLAIEMGGSISAGAGDGRMRAPYLPQMYGPELYDVMLRVKKIFDPHGILNPGVKTATTDDVKSLMRDNYHSAYRHDHLPRS